MKRALLFLAIAAQCSAQALAPGVLNPSIEHDEQFNVITFCGGAGTEPRWLTLQRHDVKSYDRKGFDPCYLTLTSIYKPIVRKMGDKWEVTFVSEIAERQP